MEVIGKIILALEETSGVSKAGKPWKKREYVMETTGGNFPQKIHFNFFGDRADQYILHPGQEIKLSFDINSREFNGRWYTDISAWKAEDVNAANNMGAAPIQAAPAASYNASYDVKPLPTELEPSGPSDDLPF